jgi:hypothetical protein
MRVIREVFFESLSLDEFNSLVKDIEMNSAFGPGSAVAHIDQEVLLSLFLDARAAMMRHATQVRWLPVLLLIDVLQTCLASGVQTLASMFEAADVNGDGQLSAEEFAALIKHMKPSVPAEQVFAQTDLSVHVCVDAVWCVMPVRR